MENTIHNHFNINVSVLINEIKINIPITLLLSLVGWLVGWFSYFENQNIYMLIFVISLRNMNWYLVLSSLLLILCSLNTVNTCSKKRRRIYFCVKWHRLTLTSLIISTVRNLLTCYKYHHEYIQSWLLWKCLKWLEHTKESCTMYIHQIICTYFDDLIRNFHLPVLNLVFIAKNQVL